MKRKSRLVLILLLLAAACSRSSSPPPKLRGSAETSDPTGDVVGPKSASDSSNTPRDIPMLDSVAVRLAGEGTKLNVTFEQAGPVDLGREEGKVDSMTLGMMLFREGKLLYTVSVSAVLGEKGVTWKADRTDVVAQVGVNEKFKDSPNYAFDPQYQKEVGATTVKLPAPKAEGNTVALSLPLDEFTELRRPFFWLARIAGGLVSATEKGLSAGDSVPDIDPAKLTVQGTPQVGVFPTVPQPEEAARFG